MLIKSSSSNLPFIQVIILAVCLTVIKAQINGPVASPPYDGVLPMPTSDTVLGEPLSQRELEGGRTYAVANITRASELIKKGLESETRKLGSRSIQRGLGKRWPNNVVPYTIDALFTPAMRTVIASGIDNVQDNTCVTFRAKEESDKDWMEIKGTGSGCSAVPYFLGPGHGVHEVTLEIDDFENGATCVDKGVVVHELLHILGVAHEQQRPDRDQFVTMDWPNIKLAFVNNMWRDSWETEDVSSLTQCDTTGVSQATANFDNCVSGDTVTAFDIAYDFKSVMHYPLDSFAVDPSKNAFSPKDPSITDIGGSELSGPDIQKLRRGYYCESATVQKCGGYKYSATGGSLTGETVSGTDTCETILSTDIGKGIKLNVSPTFAGTCDTDYLEVRYGSKRTGDVYKKFCKDEPLPSGLKINASPLFLTWKKTTSTMSGTWEAVSNPCSCQKVELTGSKDGTFDGVWTKEAEDFGGKAAYAKDEDVPGIVGKLYLYHGQRPEAPATLQSWHINTEKGSQQFYYANKLSNLLCAEDLTSGWQGIGVGGSIVDDSGATVKCNDPTTTAAPTTAPPPTTQAPSTTKAPEVTTAPPEATTAAPEVTTAQPEETTTASGSCNPCQNVVEGPLSGKYTLLFSTEDSSCPGGCVYSREGDSDKYCLEPNGLYTTEILTSGSCNL